MFNVKCQMSNVVPLVTMLLSLALFGCNKNPDPSQDAKNRTEPDTGTMRIISMAPNLTEILFALGLGEEIVGVTKFSTYPPEAKEIQNVGTFWQPDIEAVLACRPTLVLTLGFAQQTILADRLKHIGCETLTLDIESIQQLYSAIEVIGQKIDKVSEAQLLIEKLQHKQTLLVEKYADASPRKVLWVIQREPLRVAGTHTFVNELIEVAGGVNAIGDTIHQYPPISDEEVIGSMPDVIVEPVMDPEQFESQKETAKEFYKQFGMVPAVQNGRICIIDGDLVSRLGPRLDEGLQMIAKYIWSE
jgi:iron complex transport system substrate-binding protein